MMFTDILYNLRDLILYQVMNNVNKDLTTSQEGISIISKFEGFRDKPYLCPANFLTIGFGTRIPSRAPYEPNGISVEAAQKMLKDHLKKKVEPVIKKRIKVELTQKQFDALASFVYNLGEGGLFNVGTGEETTICRLLNEGEYTKAALQFQRWNKFMSKGKLTPSAGLTRRRLAEEALFLGKEWKLF